jgi:hypothetical protein
LRDTSTGELLCVKRPSFYHITTLIGTFYVYQKDRAIVTPQWLLDSAQQGKPLPCGDYVALHDLQDETEHNCPDTDCHCRSGSESHSPPPNELSSLSESALPKSSKSAQPRDSVAAAEYDVSKLSLSHTARYSCCRASPLICPNQGLVAELDVIRRSRSLEGEERSALSYQRAIAVSCLSVLLFDLHVKALLLGNQRSV